MKIAYNPSQVPLGSAPVNNDITFDLPGRVIYARGIKFSGTDTVYDVFKKDTSTLGGGNVGLVPVPDYNLNSKTRFLREDGTWQNIVTSYELVSSTAAGLAPAIGTSTSAIISNQVDEWVLTSTKGATPTWRKLPANAFENNDTTYTFASGNGGFTVTPSGGTAQTVSIGNIDSSRVNTLTNYSKATTIASIVNTDTLNVALGKLEYKLDFIYNDLIGGENNANVIDKWSEIKDFIAEVGNSTDITDVFVTRKTAQTVTGLKTFIDRITINTTAANKTPKLTLKEHYTSSSSWISEIVSDYYGTNVCATENFTHGLYIILGRQLFDNLNILDSTKTPIARISKEKGHWFDGTLTASSFIKSDSSDSYVLLGGGGHKAISDFMLKSDELTNNLIEIEKTLTVSKDWIDTGIIFDSTTFPTGTGSYMVQLSRDDAYYYTGYLSVIISSNVTEAKTDEIILHGGGFDMTAQYYLRTVQDADNKVIKLLIARSSTYSTSKTYIFKFKKLI